MKRGHTSCSRPSERVYYQFAAVCAGAKATGNQSDRLKEELKAYRQGPRFLIYPMGKKPHGLRYNITFLNELHDISLPDQVEVRRFTLDLQGDEEWESQTILRYSGYQFFGVDVKDLFQPRK